MRERFPTVEADDIIQETFISISRILPSYRYDPDEKGHFRNYLTGILRNKARHVLDREQHRAQIISEASDLLRDDRACRDFKATGGLCLSRPDEEEIQSWRESLFEVALCQFRADESVAERTKRIFERTAINGESPEAVAIAFKMTRHAIDQTKCRALARLREIVKKLESLADG